MKFKLKKVNAILGSTMKIEIHKEKLAGIAIITLVNFNAGKRKKDIKTGVPIC